MVRRLQGPPLSSFRQDVETSQGELKFPSAVRLVVRPDVLPVRTNLWGAPITAGMVRRGTKLLVVATAALVVVFGSIAYLAGSGSPFLFWFFTTVAIVMSGFFAWYLYSWVLHLNPRI
jgi:hypothetical protein